MRKKWYQRWNLYGYREYSPSLYWSVFLIPTLEITWVNGNRSLHFDFKFFLWGVKFNTFWNDAEPAIGPLFSEADWENWEE